MRVITNGVCKPQPVWQYGISNDLMRLPMDLRLIPMTLLIRCP